MRNIICKPSFWKKDSQVVPGRVTLTKPPSPPTPNEAPNDEANNTKLTKFELLLSKPFTVAELAELSWSGIPNEIRPSIWRLLLGYVPVNLDRREEVLKRKRSDYFSAVEQYYEQGKSDNWKTYHQIHIDVPRMNPSIPLFQHATVQFMIERILFVWALRHPASGYVQGINDLVTPFFVVFLQETIGPNIAFETNNLNCVPPDKLDMIEADSFWCLSKFMNDIQDNYVFAQMGIQKKINQLKDLIQRVDKELHEHLVANSVDYLQFAFRWLNNLLTREMPLRCIIRLWDTYLAECDTFATFQLYVCAAFLLRFRDELLALGDFQAILTLLQNAPTRNWNGDDIKLLIAEAYKLKFVFADAPNHFQSTTDNV